MIGVSQPQVTAITVVMLITGHTEQCHVLTHACCESKAVSSYCTGEHKPTSGSVPPATTAFSADPTRPQRGESQTAASPAKHAQRGADRGGGHAHTAAEGGKHAGDDDEVDSIWFL